MVEVPSDAIVLMIASIAGISKSIKAFPVGYSQKVPKIHVIYYMKKKIYIYIYILYENFLSIIFFSLFSQK